MILGIMGKIGTGKSTCIKYIKEYKDAVIFSCDEIAKNMIETGEVKITFDKDDFFTNTDSQEKIRNDFHPKVFNKIKNEIDELSKNSLKNRVFVIETALPSEAFFNICDKTVLIDSKNDTIIKRLMANRDYVADKTLKILKSQEYYERFYNKADHVITNDEDEDSFINKVKEVIDEICFVCE